MNRIPDSKIDEIRSSANIINYISRYVVLKKAGKNFKSLCPFHQEKTPSFIVSPEKQIYHCFGCGKGGDIFNFLKEVENISYIEAVRKVAFDQGIRIPEISQKTGDDKSEYDILYHINQLAKDFFIAQLKYYKNKGAYSYLKKRSIKQTTINKFDIGYAPDKWDSFLHSKHIVDIDRKKLQELGLIQKREAKEGYYDKFRNRIIFPFHNVSGRIVGFGGRAIIDTDQPKYLNSPESIIYKKGDILYGLHQAITAIREKNFLIIVEGYFDLLRLVDAGIENVVASSGTALTENQARLIRRYTNCAIISYDSDDAGIKAALRNSLILESLDVNVYIIQIPVPYDPDSFILNKGKAEYVKLLNQKITAIEFRLSEFFKLHPDPSIEEKNNFIIEILESLLNINNEVKIGLYIHKIANQLSLAESLIIEHFNRLKRQRNFSHRNAFVQKTDKENITGDAPAERKEKFAARKGQWKAEEGIITLLLSNHPEINKQILYQISAQDFTNEDFREIFEQISHKWEQSGNIKPEELKHDIYSDKNKQLLTKLLLTEINNPNKFAHDCVYQLKKWQLNLRFNEIKQLMKEESSSQEAVMHYMQELTDIRQKLTDIEKEWMEK
jgi:DNA primase